MTRAHSSRSSPRSAIATLAQACRRAADWLIALVSRVLLSVFFREVEVVGRERIPRGRPLLLVASHVNSLVDPILILAALDVRPRFLAKSTLWSHPVVAPLLLVSGALPVYRAQDEGEDVSRNRGTFARCRDHLAQGGSIALFPEGRSHNQPHRLPLKTGAARIALEAEEVQGPLGLRIVPLGITYEDKGRFRSSVLLSVADPIDPGQEDGRGRVHAVRALTERIAAGLGEVEISFSSWGEARLVDQALAVALSDELERCPPPSRLWRLRREAIVRYRHLLATDADRAARLTAALARCGPDPAAFAVSTSAPPRVGAGGRPFLLLPALVGAVLNVVPYKIPGWIADRLTRTPDEPATYKLLSALVTFPLFWSLEIAAAAAGMGWVAGLLTAIAAPVTGYAALLYRDEARAVREDREQRRALAAEAASPELMQERARLREELIGLLTGPA